MEHQFTIYALGDSAAAIELGSEMSEALNRRVLAMQKWFERNNFAGLKDIVVAYSSLTLVYDPFIVATKHRLNGTVYQWIENRLQLAYKEAVVQPDAERGINRIPVCYDEELGFDLKNISAAKALPIDEIIHLHVSKTYRVYMLGFLPGFAYLGELEPQLSMSRKENPVPVPAGSIGIVSNQTGIYPLYSPAGWQIIGRTPVKLFDADAEEPVKLKPGDKVQFYKISLQEFHNNLYTMSLHP